MWNARGRSEMDRPTAVVVGVGAEQGIGGAVCRRFAAEGYHVLVAGRTQSRIDRVAQAIRGRGGSAEAVLTDATDEAQVISLFDRAMGRASRRPTLLSSMQGTTAGSISSKWKRLCSKNCGASAASPVSWSGARRRGGSLRSSVAR
jgi:NAD(P)-dependent dehydrogenase (short-subunit alcohol dehydrogenase family)